MGRGGVGVPLNVPPSPGASCACSGAAAGRCTRRDECASAMFLELDGSRGCWQFRSYPVEQVSYQYHTVCVRSVLLELDRQTPSCRVCVPAAMGAVLNGSECRTRDPRHGCTRVAQRDHTYGSPTYARCCLARFREKSGSARFHHSNHVTACKRSPVKTSRPCITW